MTSRTVRAAVIALGLLLCVRAAFAQVPPPEDPIESMPIRFGPLGLATTFAITDIGVDENVFNEAGDPSRDFTATITPGVLARMRAGRALLTYTGRTGFVYFQEYSSERSVNTGNELRADLDLNRLRPFGTVRLERTRARLNNEIDDRVPRNTHGFTAGTRVLLTGRTALIGQFTRSVQTFDENSFFEGVKLSEVLDNQVDTFDGGVQFLATPFTTLSLTAAVQKDRFEASPDRDADSFRIAPRVEFSADSLIPGTLTVGYRSFDPVDPALPAYKGLVLQGDMRFAILGRTQVLVGGVRDIQYSFEPDQPYYLSTLWRATVTHRLYGPVDAQAAGTRETLEYRSRVSDDSRTDILTAIGGGIGLHPRPNWRIGINVEYSNRRGPRSDRHFDKRRIFGSLTLGTER